MATVYTIHVEPLKQEEKKDIAITINITMSQDIRDLCRGLSDVKIEGLEFDDFQTDEIMKMQHESSYKVSK